MSRTAIIALMSWVVGGAVSAWLIHGDLPLSGLVGWLVTFIVIELGTMFEHPDNVTYSPLDRIAPPLSAGAERAIGFALILIALFAVWLIGREGLGVSPPSLASLLAFVCGIPIGVAVFLFANAGRKAKLKAQQGFSTEEVVG